MEPDYLEEFRQARREAKKLDIAVHALDVDSSIDDESRQLFLDYISLRKRSACLWLIGRNDAAALKAMALRGWVEDKYMENYLQEAGRLHKMEAWATLYRIHAGDPGTSSTSAEDRNPCTSYAPTAVSVPGTLSDPAALSQQIWQLTLRRQQLAFPEMNGLFRAFTFVAHDQISYMGSDGFTLFFERSALFAQYRQSPAMLARHFLHVTLHHIYQHPLMQFSGSSEISRELSEPQNPVQAPPPDLFRDLACDLACEAMLDHYDLGEFTRPGADYRRLLLKENHLRSDRHTPQAYYELLLTHPPKEKGLKELIREFCLDDHSLWDEIRRRAKEDRDAPLNKAAAGESREGEGPGEGDSYQKKWEALRQEWAETLGEEHHKAGTAAGSGMQKVRVTDQKDGYDYREFLESFMVCREEVELDLDSFDYLPYWYSRTHYDGLIFLEPLEYREMYKLDEMVIAIDTSGSCSGSVVRQFLQETWNILSGRENFFQKMNVHIIQCDSMIQEHVTIHDQEEFLDYMEHVTIKGLGGTDFRPVFDLVDELIDTKEITRLRGLLYFTDGDGVYPPDPPSYDTAFIYLNKELEKREAPPWAIRLNLGLQLLETGR